MAEEKKVKATTAKKATVKKETTKKEAAPKKTVAKKTVAAADKVVAPKKAEKVNVASNKTESAVQAPFKNTDAKSLSKVVFTVEKNYDQAIFDTILSERASRRQGTHSVKTRAQVSGTGKKPFRQKGTGNARQGTLRAPHMPGGGVALGPVTERNYNLKVNKAVRRHALNAALTHLANANAVALSDLSMAAVKTRELVNKLAEFNADKLRHVLIVSNDNNLFMSARNLKHVKVTKVTSLLVEDLIQADALFISEADVKYLEGLLG